MRAPFISVCVAAPLALLLYACDLPGKPKPGPEVPRPEAVLSFDALYSEECAGCHGATAQQHGKAGPILDGSFLALINEQTIRTIVIAGRPDIGQPDWRNHIQGHPLTDDDITNVSAWLMAQKPLLPGQPYP